DMASLASLQNARIADGDSPDRIQLQSMDLARLASTIYEAYTGHPAAMSPEGILPMPSQAPEKVAAVFRSAIEPVQGIAPPISAGQWREQVSSALVAITELEQPGRPVQFVSAHVTDVGRLRDQNQDSYAMSEVVQSSVENPVRLALYVVADGMGGHKGGEIASALAAQTFISEVMARVLAPLASVSGERPALTNDAIMQGLVRALQNANDRIYKARDNRQNDMGTTLVAALITGGKAYAINVGDSRFYMYTRRERPSEPPAPKVNIDATSPLDIGTAPLKEDKVPLKKDTTLLDENKGRGRKKQTTLLDQEAAPVQPETGDGEETATQERQSDYALTQISVDHSLVHRLVELGQLDPEEAKVHPHRNFIYRSLGGPPPIDVDTFVRTLHPGDRLLLCSDGLNSMLEDDQIEAVLASEPDPDVAAHRLIDLANEAGGHDNITAIVVDITDYLPLPEHPAALNDA
ncbi:MAG: PP2C family protein-serine/threonine phosphatase, partial [Chloroflexia bacterium]